MNGPASVFGLRRHLSRKSFAFLTQTGGPSCLIARGKTSTANSNRNTASFPATPKRESNTSNPFRWNRSRNDRCAFRSCGYSTSSVTAGAGMATARSPPPRIFASARILGTVIAFAGRAIELEQLPLPPREAVLQHAAERAVLENEQFAQVAAEAHDFRLRAVDAD